MTWFTVLVQEADGSGTTHISAHNCETTETAMRVAMEETKDDWGRDDYEDADLRILGVLEGRPEILEWSDYGIDGEIEVPPPEEAEYSTYTIRGSHGDLVIDVTSGTVISRTGYPEIARFDLAEYRNWYKQRGEENLLEMNGEEDILDLGYWMTDERYVEPVIEHRTGEDSE